MSNVLSLKSVAVHRLQHHFGEVELLDQESWEDCGGPE
jgi:hypothetical protein